MSLGPIAAALLCLLLTPRCSSAAPHSTLVTNLPRYLARSQRMWSHGTEGSGGSVLAARQDSAVSFAGSLGTRSVKSDSAFAVPSYSAEECTSWVYRRFFPGNDTIMFTFGRAPEACSESPRMVFRSSDGLEKRVVMTPLYNWNVDAMWFTSHFLVFAVTAEFESALPQFVRITVWDLTSGRWFTTPTREGLMHRPGFDLAALLPDWYSSRVYEAGGAVILRGEKRALALRPDKKAWSLVNAVNGRPIGSLRRAIPRDVLAPAEKWIGSTVRQELRAVFARVHDRADRDVVDFNILELIRGPCTAHRQDYAVIARAVGRDRKPGGPELDGTRELFGVCILDSSLSHVTRSFAPFPTARWADYNAYFDIDAPDDSIVVWGEGDTYSDESRRFAYPCGP